MKRWKPGPLAWVVVLTMGVLAASPAWAEPGGRLSPIAAPGGTLLERGQSLLGLLMLVVGTWALGYLRNGRRAVPWRVVGWGLGLMAAFTLVVFYLPTLLTTVNDVINALLGFTKAGARVVFGDLSSFTLPVEGTDAEGRPLTGVAQHGAYFAFFVLPTIIFFSALTAVAYHSGVMQYVVQAIAWVMSKSMKTSGAETLSAAANIFVGQTEAPLMVKPFMRAATNSELMAIMVAGFANIASGVLGLYTEWLQPFVRDAGGHLAAACFISAPASLMVAKLLVPEDGTPVTAGGVKFHVERIDANLVDAAARGTSEGLTLALNVAAMLIAFTALIALVNATLGWAGGLLGLPPGGQPLTLEMILGVLFAPLAWLTGVPWSECRTVGALLGVKTVLNELIAYGQMRDLLTANPQALSPRSSLLATYALCGFANFASVGIQVGGIASIVPERRTDLARLGLLAMVGGGIATLMAAAMVGIVM
ncbi:MAG: NupC/NupG family nucleoside CNT transporter [Tepidisphaerales bacterium]